MCIITGLPLLLFPVFTVSLLSLTMYHMKEVIIAQLCILYTCKCSSLKGEKSIGINNLVYYPVLVCTRMISDCVETFMLKCDAVSHL